MLVHLVDGADIGVIQAAQGLGLPLEPPGRVGVARQILGQEFQGHRPGQAQVLPLVDDSHAAHAQLSRDPVVRNRGPDHGGQDTKAPLPVLFGLTLGGVITNMMQTQTVMTGPKPTPPPQDETYADALLSDETTMELVVRAREGDRMAVEALLQRCLPSLTRWAHGRLPPSARGALDTGDLVQEAALHALRRLDVFEPRHVGAMQAYLRQSVINRIRDEVRRVTRHPAPVELPPDHPADATSPLESAIEAESYERYRKALSRDESAPPGNRGRAGRNAVEPRGNRAALRDAHGRCGADGRQPRAQAPLGGDGAQGVIGSRRPQGSSGPGRCQASGRSARGLSPGP